MPEVSLSAVAVTLGLLFAVVSLAGIRRQGIGSGVLGVALLASAALEAGGLLVMTHPHDWEGWMAWSRVAEGGAISAWLLFSLTFARRDPFRSLTVSQGLFLALCPVLVAIGFLLPSDAFYFSPDFGDERVLFLEQAGYLYSIALLVVLIFILVQLERTLASLPRQDRWRVKYEILGAGALLAVYLVYYSQGLLYRTIDMSLLPARSLGLIAAVALMGWSRLRPGEVAPIQVSREMAYRSVVILAVGVYLLALGIFGEGMRYLGDAYRRSILLGFALAGGVGVAIVFLSETVKRKVRVFLHKSFYREKYDYRDQWLQFTAKLSASESRAALYRAILSCYAETFAIQGAALFLRDAEKGLYRCVAVYNIEEVAEVFTADNTLLRSFGEDDWIFCSRDDNPAIREENGEFLRKYGVTFAVPLRFDKKLEGFVVLGRTMNHRETLSYEDFDLMKMLARQATSTILSMQFSEELALAREMAAIGKVSAFVLHDLKNLVSNLGLMIETAREHMGNPEFQQDMLLTLDVTFRKMKGLIARLKNLEEKTELDLRVCDLQEIVREGVRGSGGGKVTVTGERVAARVDPVEIQKVALNLILNAVEAGRDRPVQIETGEAGDAFFRVRDAGCGMSEEFIRERLFRPFETTKKKGFGIGLYQCKAIVEAHGGSIEVRSRVGEGSEFTVWLPRGEKQELGVGRQETGDRRAGSQEPEFSPNSQLPDPLLNNR